MFKKITLKNYRTHIDTTIELQDITLIMGGNNVGKSNLLNGIQYFSNLISSSEKVGKNNYYPYKHCLDTSENPLFFGCEWENKIGNIVYQLELYTLEDGEIACKEKIEISTNNTINAQKHGYREISKKIQLKMLLG
ncbi:AAA family ATPase [Candidatus Marithrix sp. Canyon 246]|uniref:AAA family ATPase n=1 Tax=Candidatus Marithrix sp. Canyon 246 TaxID=1827136 RepID=UPI00084A1754|nr:AAA family ATPase [Candidatus Marithrix sp. Canyon 246]